METVKKGLKFYIVFLFFWMNNNNNYNDYPIDNDLYDTTIDTSQTNGIDDDADYVYVHRGNQFSVPIDWVNMLRDRLSR